MITNFRIFENIKTDLEIHYFLKKVVEELNNESFKIIYGIQQVNFYKNIQYNIIYKNSTILEINLYDNYLILTRYGTADTYFVYYNDKFFKKILKEKIIISFIIYNIEEQYDFNFNEEHNINMENNLDNIILEMINSKYIDVFIYLLKYKLLSITIHNIYQYLLDANNFDLI